MISTKLVFAAALIASVAVVNAQDKGAKKQGPPPMLSIKVADFADGARIPVKFTCAAGQNSPSPAISWSNATAGTQSFVLIMHDPDPVIANSTNDVLHWAIFDIPATAKGLPENVAKGDRPDGAKQIDVFLLRGSRVYRIVAVRLEGTPAQTAPTERRASGRLLDALACVLPDAQCRASRGA